jgi:hypothetical protein
MKGWRQFRRKAVVIQSLWRGKRVRSESEAIREAVGKSRLRSSELDAVGLADEGNDRFAKLPTE